MVLFFQGEEFLKRLENWRVRQLSAINAEAPSDGGRRGALLRLLQEETAILRQLHCKKRETAAEREKRCLTDFLHQVSNHGVRNCVLHEMEFFELILFYFYFIFILFFYFIFILFLFYFYFIFILFYFYFILFYFYFLFYFFLIFLLFIFF